MFVRLQWLETEGRYERMFSQFPPTLIAFFAERVNLCKGRWDPDGSTATAYIWLIWIKGKKAARAVLDTAWLPRNLRTRWRRRAIHPAPGCETSGGAGMSATIANDDRSAPSIGPKARWRPAAACTSSSRTVSGLPSAGTPRAQTCW
jgi:hypothetical protein